MSFTPRYCPRDDCLAHRPDTPFPWRRRGFFRRKVDGRRVQRFLCLTCRHSFSTQSFRLDYRLRLPRLHHAVFCLLVSKVTLRQSARLLGVRRKTVTHRFALLADHARAFHRERLERLREKGGLCGPFQLDELETFETSRRLKPVTVPVLIEEKSWFVVHCEAAPLAPRRPLKPHLEARLAEIEKVEGKRRSGSTPAVRRSFARLVELVPRRAAVKVTTDRKSSYRTALRRLLGERVRHVRVSSKQKRDVRNPLFRINVTLAMLRDGVSRLVRRSWGAAKQRAWLERHLWVWVAWRNYLRVVVNDRAQCKHASPASLVGAARRKLSSQEVFTWRVGPSRSASP